MFMSSSEYLIQSSFKETEGSIGGSNFRVIPFLPFPGSDLLENRFSPPSCSLGVSGKDPQICPLALQ